MRRRFDRFSAYFCCLTILAITAQGCQWIGGRPDSERASGDLAQIVATVNEQKISLGDFVKELDAHKATLAPNILENEKLYSELKANLLTRMITQELLRQEAARLELSVSSDEIQAEIQRQRGNTPEDQWQKLLLARGQNHQALADIVAKQILQKKLEESQVRPRVRSVSEAEILRVFKASYEGKLPGPMIQLAQIFLGSREQAEDIKQKISSKSLSFTQAAQQFGQSPDAAKGGDLGWVIQGQTIPEFDLAFSLNVGQVSSVIPSARGFHLLLVKGKRPNKPWSLDEKREDILRRLNDEYYASAYSEWLTDLETRARIAKNTLLLEGL